MGQHLYKEKTFHDILLISTDFIPIKAHKTVLFAGSNFFKTLFNIELDQASNSVLYLKELELEGFSSDGDMNINILKDEVEVEDKAVTETDSNEKLFDIGSKDDKSLQSYTKLDEDSKDYKNHVLNEIESLKKRLKNTEPVLC